MIAEVEDQLDSETRFQTYRVELVPRAFRLTLVETRSPSNPKTAMMGEQYG
jgi:hypothetical protein